jgi:RNA polymerase sigma-70 factor (ECF subfamily)
LAVSQRPAGEAPNRWTDLFLRARRDAPELYGVLAEEVRPLLLGLLRGDPGSQALRHGPVDHEDIVQEALLRAWARRLTFDPGKASFTTWLFAIARNAAIDASRQRRRRPTQSLPGPSEPVPASRLRAGEESSEPELPVERLREALAEAIRGFDSPRAREALAMRLVVGKPYAVISQELGIPVGTLATWVHRLRRGLRGRLEA